MKPLNMSENIEEKIENVEVEKIIDTIYSLAGNKSLGDLDINYKNFGERLGLSKEACAKIKATKDKVSISIYYDNEYIFQIPKNVELIDKSEKKEIYTIYRISFCIKLVKDIKKFSNPLIILNHNDIKEFSCLKDLFTSYHPSFQIIDKSKIDYEKIFNQEAKDEQKKNGLFYSLNFKYYFDYPNPTEEFFFVLSKTRTGLFNFKDNNKIIAIAGNFGIGKSTTLLMSKDKYKNILYLNLKSLIKNENNVFIWKYQLLLLEIATCFKNVTTFDNFKKIKEEIEKNSIIWDSILDIVKFIIEKRLKIILILDQFKQKFDNNYSNISQIIKLIKKDESESIRLIISCSLNNKDVRIFLLKSWFPNKYKKVFSLFNYYYFYTLFESKKLIDNDLALTTKQRELIKNFFNYIPIYYYAIKNIKDNLLEEYKSKQREIIKDNIIVFYEENTLGIDNICLLLDYRLRFGTSLEENELADILSILPIKYFIKDNNTVNFYFNLVKEIFDDYLTGKICRFLTNPKLFPKEGIIGDILEFHLINDLKKNIFQEFDEIVKVDTIMNLIESENINKININEKCILILQTNSYAPLFDFGILFKGKDLILFQCKKVFKREPKNFPTRDIINENKVIISDNFKRKFETTIENIYLAFITGISFFIEKGKIKSRTWGNNEDETFKKIEEISEVGESLLLYYDVIEKNIYCKISNTFEKIDKIINFIKLISPVKVSVDLEKLPIQEKNKYFLDLSYLSEVSKLKKRFENYRQKKIDDEEFLTMENIATFMKSGYKIKNNIIGICDNPKNIDLLHENMYIGIKTKRSNYLTIKDEDKDRKIYEIQTDQIIEIKNNIENIFEENVIKCYYYLYDKKKHNI